jgi:mannose-6-phosphate isomerase-like protein (cupin superfamily)
MDELQKGLDISVRGPVRDDALARFDEQMAAWQIAMPPVEPLVLDFGLGDFEHTGLIEYWIANEVDAGYCGKYLFVFDGQTCPTHHHLHKMETFFLVKGRLTVAMGEQEIQMTPGDVLTVRPGRRHSFTGVGPALLLELSKPCVIEDNVFADEAIPIGRSSDASG